MKGNFYSSVLFVLSFSISIDVKSYLDTKKALKNVKRIFFPSSEKHFFEKNVFLIYFQEA